MISTISCISTKLHSILLFDFDLHNCSRRAGRRRQQRRRIDRRRQSGREQRQCAARRRLKRHRPTRRHRSLATPTAPKPNEWQNVSEPMHVWYANFGRFYDSECPTCDEPRKCQQYEVAEIERLADGTRCDEAATVVVGIERKKSTLIQKS
jgi:hypothetical protein